MTSATFTFKSQQPDVYDLAAWSEQLGGAVTFRKGVARIEFDVEVDTDHFGGETNGCMG